MSASGRSWVLGGALLAASGGTVLAAPCATATLAAYIAGPACTVDNESFSAFQYFPSAAGVPTAADITVTPEPAAPGQTNPGLLFSDNWDNQTGVGQDASLLFTITQVGTGSITGATLQVTGTGSFDDTETQVPPSQLNIIDTDNALHSQLFIPSQTTFRVSDDILLNNGAHISSIDKRFLQEPTPPVITPEPGTLSTLGVALLLLAGWGWGCRTWRVPGAQRAA